MDRIIDSVAVHWLLVLVVFSSLRIAARAEVSSDNSCAPPVCGRLITYNEGAVTLAQALPKYTGVILHKVAKYTFV